MESIIYREAYAFSIRVVKAHQYLTSQKHEYEMSTQLKRSGTSIASNLAEAHYAQSRPDWLSKMSIALKEANESKNWIKLLHDTQYIDDAVYESIMKDCLSIIYKLARILRTAKDNDNDVAGRN